MTEDERKQKERERQEIAARLSAATGGVATPVSYTSGQQTVQSAQKQAEERKKNG